MKKLLEELSYKGCDVNRGIERSMGREDYYIERLKRFAESDYVDKLDQAYTSRDLKKCRLYACSLESSCFSLGLKPMHYLSSNIINLAGRSKYSDLGIVLERLKTYQQGYISILNAQ